MTGSARYAFFSALFTQNTSSLNSLTKSLRPYLLLSIYISEILSYSSSLYSCFPSLTEAITFGSPDGFISDVFLLFQLYDADAVLLYCISISFCSPSIASRLNLLSAPFGTNISLSIVISIFSNSNGVSPVFDMRSATFLRSAGALSAWLTGSI